MKRSVAFTGFVLSCSAFALFAARSPDSQPAPQYVGGEACKSCHEPQWESHVEGVHGQGEGRERGCESCHGPGSLHVEAAGDRSAPGFASVRRFKAMSAADASAACRTCHVAGDQIFWEDSRHARRDVSCVECHSIHGATGAEARPGLLTKANVNDLCMQCHKDKRASFSRSAHMPLREGSMNCADCHNPHGSEGPRMIRAASANDLCLSCHADKRGPFLWEHPPVRENCLSCHQPHGANNAKVLASKEPYLCQRCHIANRHPSTLYDRPDLSSNRLLNRSCTNCHANIHGSNHPSGKTFLR